jgi:uncharacterized protein (TIGR00369 family)
MEQKKEQPEGASANQPEKTGEIGLVPRELMLLYSGLEILGKLMRGELPAPPMSRLIPFHLLDLTEGRAVLESQPMARFYNTMGICHGGYAMTLLDTCMGVSIYTRLGPGIGYTTIETKVNFVRPLTKQTGTIHGIGTAVHVGHRTGTAEGRLIDASGKVYAHGTTTCFLYPLEA